MQQTFAIAVHGTLPDSFASLRALHFARALVQEGHNLYRVFFYYSGASIANGLAVAPQDEPDIAQEWLDFGAQHDVELAVCVATGQRRGVLSYAEQQRYQKAAASALPGFTIVGLGQMVDAAIVADRFVTFPS